MGAEDSVASEVERKDGVKLFSGGPLLREVLSQAGPLPVDASPERILALAEAIGRVSPSCAVAFLRVCPSVLPFLLRDEVTDWEILGSGRMGWMGRGGEASLSVDSRPSEAPALPPGWFESLRAWADSGREIAESCPETAIQFFRTTPSFLEHQGIFQVRQWAECALNLLALGPEGDKAAMAFLKASPTMLAVMPLREFLQWNLGGMRIAAESASAATEYYSRTPKAWSVLTRSERKEVIRLVVGLAENAPREALGFSFRCAEALMGCSPAVRGRVLEVSRKMAGQRACEIPSVFLAITESLCPLSYPAQEGVLNSGVAVGCACMESAGAYFRNIAQVLGQIPDHFLSHWVAKGLSLSAECGRRTLDYFSLTSPEARSELLKWKHAVLLRDHGPALALFASALAGSPLQVKSTEEQGTDGAKGNADLAATDGQRIFLPPFAAGAPCAAENLRHYKVATAHQAGYVEWGTFSSGLPSILTLLASFPLPELAQDLFSIIEDGRVDHCLRQEYAGLREDMDLVVSRALEARPALGELALCEALVEALLFVTLGRMDGKKAPESLSPHLPFLRASLDGFYCAASGPWECLLKAAAIYDYMSRLPGVSDYRARPVIAFRGKLRLSRPFRPDGTGPLAEHVENRRPGSEEEGKWLPIALKDPCVKKHVGRKPANRGEVGTTDSQAPDKPQDQDPWITRVGDGARPRVLDRFHTLDRDGPFFYDEWDHLQGAYRPRWCRLLEREVEPLDTGVIDAVHTQYRDLIFRVRRQFQRIRPGLFEVVRKVEWGDEIDLSALIQAVVDRRAGDTPSERIFSRKEKKIRRISTLLLVDMSASTSERVPPVHCGDLVGQGRPETAGGGRRILDIEIESLVVIMEALEALNDAYAVFGFSGYGRNQVDFYRIKDFPDPYGAEARARVSGIQPKHSTRMGAAIRHASTKLRLLDSDQRLLIVLSDGYPQDHDYGEDRRCNEYGLHDTMMALLEARREGIRPFCITVDRSGNDYLRKMCDPGSYLVIQDIFSLPQILPRVVESLMA